MKAETCAMVSNFYVRYGNTVYVYDQTTSSFISCFDIANESFANLVVNKSFGVRF